MGAGGGRLEFILGGFVEDLSSSMGTVNEILWLSFGHA